MGNEGISLGGGLGGVGGGETKPLRGLSDLGKPDESAVTQFRQFAGKADTNQTSTQVSIEVKGPSGPFDFQTNRITMAPSQASLGEQLVGKVMEASSGVRHQEQNIMDNITKAKEKGWTNADTLTLQFEMGMLAFNLDVGSKIAGKMVQGVTTVIKQQ